MLILAYILPLIMHIYTSRLIVWNGRHGKKGLFSPFQLQILKRHCQTNIEDKIGY